MDNSANAVWQGVTNIAVLQQGGTNADIAATNSGYVFVPKTPELFSYDADGNLTNDGHFSYSWDGENRLVRVVSNTGFGPQYRIDFAYDL